MLLLLLVWAACPFAIHCLVLVSLGTTSHRRECKGVLRWWVGQDALIHDYWGPLETIEDCAANAFHVLCLLQLLLVRAAFAVEQ